MNLQRVKVFLQAREVTDFIMMTSYLSPSNVSDTEHELEDAVSPTDDS